MYVALLGDSTFDNAMYVPNSEPAVRMQVRHKTQSEFGKKAQVTLLAQDGACVRHVHDQISRLPDGITHTLLSVGGNDGLRFMGEMYYKKTGVDQMADKIRSQFHKTYQSVVQRLVEKDLQPSLFTIYSGNFTSLAYNKIVDELLPVMNEVIREAGQNHGLPLVELDNLMEPEDYANKIEPGVSGGEKIAGAAVRALQVTTQTK